MSPRRKSQTPLFESLTLEEISSEYSTWTYQFAQSPFAAALARIVEHEMPPPHSIPLTQCICVGLGNFAQGNVYPGEEESKKLRYPSLHQLVFLTFVLTLLGRKGHDARIENKDVYFQDPVLSPVEITFLQQSLGYTVLSNPAAYAKMTPSTFLFAPCAPHFVRALALEVAMPALYVGVDVDMDLERMGPSDLCSSTNVPMQATFGRLRTVTQLRRLPDGEGKEWEHWISVNSMRWAKGRTRSATAVKGR